MDANTERLLIALYKKYNRSNMDIAQWVASPVVRHTPYSGLAVVRADFEDVAKHLKVLGKEVYVLAYDKDFVEDFLHVCKRMGCNVDMDSDIETITLDDENEDGEDVVRIYSIPEMSYPKSPFVLDVYYPGHVENLLRQREEQERMKEYEIQHDPYNRRRGYRRKGEKNYDEDDRYYDDWDFGVKNGKSAEFSTANWRGSNSGNKRKGSKNSLGNNGTFERDDLTDLVKKFSNSINPIDPTKGRGGKKKKGGKKEENYRHNNDLLTEAIYRAIRRMLLK